MWKNESLLYGSNIQGRYVLLINWYTHYWYLNQQYEELFLMWLWAEWNHMSETDNSFCCAVYERISLEDKCYEILAKLLWERPGVFRYRKCRTQCILFVSFSLTLNACLCVSCSSRRCFSCFRILTSKKRTTDDVSSGISLHSFLFYLLICAAKNIRIPLSYWPMISAVSDMRADVECLFFSAAPLCSLSMHTSWLLEV